MDSKGRYYTEETLRSEVIEPELERLNRAERRKQQAEQRSLRQRKAMRTRILPDKATSDQTKEG
jgi:hypothetical protein